MKISAWLRRLAFPVGVCLLCVTLLLAGCGGGGGSEKSTSSPLVTTAATGRATLSIKWPARSGSRLFPLGANSLRVDVLRGPDVFTTRLIPRPADPSVPTVVTFDTLPVDTLTVQATVYPNADGTGVAQAAGSAPLVIVADQITNFGTLTMGTTIATITVTPPSGGTSVVAGSAPQQWTATARDASGAVVLVTPSKQKWESSDVLVATVDAATGLVAPVGPGTATITETDTESGIAGSASITVTAASAVTVTVSHLAPFSKSVYVEVFKGAIVQPAYPGAVYKTVVFSGVPVAKMVVPRLNNEASVTASFPNLASGTYQIRAVSNLSPTVASTLLAMAMESTEITTLASGTTPVSLSLSTTIYKISISSSGDEIAQGQTKQMGTGALSYSSFPVPTDPSQFSWSSSDASVGSIDAASGLATMLKGGSVTFTVKESESGKTASVSFEVVGAIVPQFNPRDPVHIAAGIPTGLTALSGDTYQFDTDAAPSPTLTDTTTKTLIAKGHYVTQTFGTARTSVTYAIFDFAGDISIGGNSKFVSKGNCPVVLLTQNNALVDTGAVIDLSANGVFPGAGGGAAKNGPGAGKVGGPTQGGGGFGGQGGNVSSSYGVDLAGQPNPHLQGGSGGYSGGAGGGALYFAAWGTLTIRNASIKAKGSDAQCGGSGGAIVLLAGQGVTLTQATVDAGGGKAIGATYGGGGGGGRIHIGYGSGAAPDMTLVSALGGVCVLNPSLLGGDGYPGKIYVFPFGGF